MLSLVSTPIGDLKDISLRALEVLKAADIIIGEERREASTLLKRLDIPVKELYLLNEHSNASDVEELLNLCKHKNVALISDCGTPSFYDPGYQLVEGCRRKQIKVVSVPGASSLMGLMSLVSRRVTSFYFAGFLPADTSERQSRFKSLIARQEALVLMDTPYRLLKMMGELETLAPHRSILLGLNLTQETEIVLEGSASEILKNLNQKGIERAEFILLVYAATEKKDFSAQRSKGSLSRKTPSSPRGHQRPSKRSFEKSKAQRNK